MEIESEDQSEVLHNNHPIEASGSKGIEEQMVEDEAPEAGAVSGLGNGNTVDLTKETVDLTVSSSEEDDSDQESPASSYRNDNRLCDLVEEGTLSKLKWTLEQDTSDKWKALLRAVKYSEKEMVKLLLQHLPFHDVKTPPRTPPCRDVANSPYEHALLKAAWDQDPEILRMLLKHQLNSDKMCISLCENPTLIAEVLEQAIVKGTSEGLALLLEYGAGNVFEQTDTASGNSTTIGFPVELLMCLDQAMAMAHETPQIYLEDTIKKWTLVVDEGQKYLTMKCRSSGNTFYGGPLSFILTRGCFHTKEICKCAIDVAKLLLEKGASVHEKSDSLRTPLHHASLAKCSLVPVLELLIEHGANLNVRDVRGNNALCGLLEYSCTQDKITGDFPYWPPCYENVCCLLQHGSVLQDKCLSSMLECLPKTNNPDFRVLQLALSLGYPVHQLPAAKSLIKLLGVDDRMWLKHCPDDQRETVKDFIRCLKQRPKTVLCLAQISRNVVQDHLIAISDGQSIHQKLQQLSLPQAVFDACFSKEAKF